MTVFGITRFSDAPILLVSVALPLENYLPSLVSVASQIQRFTVPNVKAIYVVVDLRGCEVSLSDTLLLIQECREAAPGWTLTTTVFFLVVGTHPLIAVGIKRIWEQLTIPVRQFATMSEALSYVRGACG